MLKSIFAAPASWIYKFVVTLRHKLFDWGVLRSQKFDVPIICVGNITVGGTGKTPMVELIIKHLSKSYNIAVISRGYGRRTKGYIEVKSTSHYREVGDEPLQIKLKFPNTVVVACEKRAEGISRIIEQYPDINLIIMDDGFQHRYVEPKINIVMTDATRPIQHDKMIPAGNLRDIPEMLHRAHYIFVTKCPDNIKPLDQRIFHKVLISLAYQQLYFTRIANHKPSALYTDIVTHHPTTGSEVIALSGVGNPAPFIDGLKKRYNVIEEITHPDHHVYIKGDLYNLAHILEKHPNAVIITTEKDAVKMRNPKAVPQIVKERLFYIPIDTQFIGSTPTEFLQKLEEDVRKN